MKIKLASKTNANGARKQILIDIDKKTFSRGYFLFTGADVSELTSKQMQDLLQLLNDNSFLEV